MYLEVYNVVRYQQWKYCTALHCAALHCTYCTVVLEMNMHPVANGISTCTIFSRASNFSPNGQLHSSVNFQIVVVYTRPLRPRSHCDKIFAFPGRIKCKNYNHCHTRKRCDESNGRESWETMPLSWLRS